MRVIGWFPLLLGLVLPGCGRSLPGPSECRAFALASIGVKPGTPAAALARHPELYVKAESITRQCLTTPWDYKLLNCVASGSNSRACLRSFEARRLGVQATQ